MCHKKSFIYVSPLGDDSNSGEKYSPVRHLEKAITLAFDTAFQNHDVIIQLYEGKYSFSKPLALDALKMEKLNSLTFCGSGASETKCSGSRAIFPQWQPYRDGIYVSRIEKGLAVDGLLCNNALQIMARYPNYEEDAVLNGFDENALSKERVKKWKNPTGGYIRALHHAEWGGNSYVITGKTESGELSYRWVGDNNRGNEMHPTKRMVENIFEELDAPKEWYYNPENGDLFFYPEKESDLTKNFEVILVSQLFRVTGISQERPVRQVTFEGIGFEQTARTMFTERYERILRSDWSIARAGVIYLENTENVIVKNCSFHQIGGNAVTLSGYNKNHLVDHNEFTAIGATGVLVAGSTCSVRDASEYDGDRHKTAIHDFTVGPMTEDYPRQILISNNYFYHVGTCEKQAAAICLSVSSDVTVRANTIHLTSRAGININTGAFGGHIIEDNDMFDCVTETADHGPFNSWGRDRYWSVPQYDTMGHYGKEKRAFAELDACKTTVIRHNRIHANHGFGLDLDDGSTNYDIYNNLCLGVGIKLRDGFDRKVHNNLLVGCGFDLHASFAQNNDLIYSNVVFFNKAYNQICVNEGSTTICSHNLYWNSGEKIAGIPDEDFGSLIADPCFTDFEKNDFHLSEQSPAFMLGFINFPMKNEDFGRKDKPNPPPFYYYPTQTNRTLYHYHDVVLCDIEDEGIRSAAGLPDYNGAYVVSQKASGLFHKLNVPIDVGDVIVQVGNTVITACPQLIECFDSLHAGIPTEITFYHCQSPLTLHFTLPLTPQE